MLELGNIYSISDKSSEVPTVSRGNRFFCHGALKDTQPKLDSQNIKKLVYGMVILNVQNNS